MSDIVIIEEDTQMCSLLTEWLTAEGYRVNGVGSDHARVRQPVDLVIVDVYMPRHLGIERLRSARNEYPGAPIIAMSGQFQPGVAGAGPAAQALGVDRVIAKPFRREALIDAVRSVIRQRADAPR
jgi:DNA-binding response OmpR family regulator